MKRRRNSATSKLLAKVGGKTAGKMAVKTLGMEVGIGEVMGAIDAAPVAFEVAKEEFREGKAGAKRLWQAARKGDYRKAAKEALSTGAAGVKRGVVGAGKTATAFFTSREAADALMPVKQNGYVLRTNKPMPESPKAVALVMAARRQLEREFRADLMPRPWPEFVGKTQVLIPWDHFVFSTRDGKPYMPPSIQKGLDRIQNGYETGRPEVTKRGVLLTIGLRPPTNNANGAFYPYDLLMGVPPRDSNPSADATLRHEMLHLTQMVGSNLIEAGLGFSEVFSQERMDRPQRATRRRGKEQRRMLDYGQVYGMPKRRSHAKFGEFWSEIQALGAPDRKGVVHFLSPIAPAHHHRPVEFHANSLTDAAAIMEHAPYSRESDVATMIDRVLARRWWDEKTKTLDMRSPQRIYDYAQSVWHRVVDEHNATYGTHFGLKIPENAFFLRKIKAEIQKAKQKSAPSARPPISRSTAPAPEPPPPARNAPPPARPSAAPKRAPAAKVSGWTVKQEPTPLAAGRVAFVIYKDGAPTGKYFFSADKANAYIAKAK